ncbi:MAG: Rieske 2Fe-2S domain-containing protein, partial [Limisphaerales bacterium]
FRSRLSPDSVPFQALGFVAFFILLVMAATSHDFWLAHLTAPVWKALHMSVYAAYAILVLHVTFGVLQTESSSVFAVATGGGFAVVAGLHLLAGFRERHRYRGLDEQNGRSEAGPRVSDADWVDACGVDEIPEGRARIVSLASERVAIFRYGGLVSAVSNVCQHQNGPLGEGRILHGCITCPWHGYQYQPADGASPAPFSEKVPTFRVRVWDGRVFVDPHPFPAGTRVEPARIGQGSDGGPSAAERTAARGAITGSSRSDPPSPS